MVLPTTATYNLVIPYDNQPHAVTEAKAASASAPVASGSYDILGVTLTSDSVIANTPDASHCTRRIIMHLTSEWFDRFPNGIEHPMQAFAGLAKSAVEKSVPTILTASSESVTLS